MTRSRFLWMSAVSVMVAMLVLARQAHADAPPQDDGQQIVALIDLLMSGKYLPAVGGFLIAAVYVLRGGLGRWLPWFQTRPGKYVLGFGSAAVLYIGAAMQADRLTPGVFLAALGAGWAAAGGLEHFKDMTSWLANRSGGDANGAGPTILRGVTLGCALAMLPLLAQASCTQAKHAEAAIIDCTGGGTQGLVGNILSTLDQWHQDEAHGGCLTSSGYDWNCIEQKAIAKGEQIGGCAIAELVQSVIGGTKATPVDSSWLARAALEEFRARAAGGATFHTATGDL